MIQIPLIVIAVILIWCCGQWVAGFEGRKNRATGWRVLTIVSYLSGHLLSEFAVEATSNQGTDTSLAVLFCQFLIPPVCATIFAALVLIVASRSNSARLGVESTPSNQEQPPFATLRIASWVLLSLATAAFAAVGFGMFIFLPSLARILADQKNELPLSTQSLLRIPPSIVTVAIFGLLVALILKERSKLSRRITLLLNWSSLILAVESFAVIVVVAYLPLHSSLESLTHNPRIMRLNWPSIASTSAR